MRLELLLLFTSYSADYPAAELLIIRLSGGYHKLFSVKHRLLRVVGAIGQTGPLHFILLPKPARSSGARFAQILYYAVPIHIGADFAVVLCAITSQARAVLHNSVQPRKCVSNTPKYGFIDLPQPAT
jgi:hypothetical protein